MVSWIPPIIVRPNESLRRIASEAGHAIEMNGLAVVGVVLQRCAAPPPGDQHQRQDRSTGQAAVRSLGPWFR